MNYPSTYIFQPSLLSLDSESVQVYFSIISVCTKVARFSLLHKRYQELETALCLSQEMRRQVCIQLLTNSITSTTICPGKLLQQSKNTFSESISVEDAEIVIFCLSRAKQAVKNKAIMHCIYTAVFTLPFGGKGSNELPSKTIS